VTQGPLPVSYEGPARLGGDGFEVLLRINDVEAPDWIGVISESAGMTVGAGEVTVVLLGAGLYEGWAGTAVPSNGGDGQVRLMGREPLTPPVGG
jgi:hypothetical protein